MKRPEIKENASPTDLENIEKYINFLEAENARLHNLIHTPHTDDFLSAVPLEAAFQISHWGTEHDAGKTPFDWYRLIRYLAAKATRAANSGDIEKTKHHCISVSGVMLNWYRRLSGDDRTFQPGFADGKKLETESVSQ